jgi:LuxR family transcriptional regulator, quorum-sensing system regulator CviR
MTVLEIAHGCVSCRTEREFRDLYRKIGELVPFDFGCAVSGRLGRRRVVMLDSVNLSYPATFIDEYVSRDYFRVDNVMREALATSRARYCSESSAGRPREITALCRDFGVAEGYFVGATSPGPEGGGSLFLFKSRSMKRERRTAGMLELLAPHLHHAFFRAFDREQPRATPVLSAREREILRWLYEGKSSWETSVILGISERTVNFHVYNAFRKLGAATRPQALAIAARCGLLD